MASIINVLAVFGAVSLLYLLGLVYSTFSQFLYPSKLPRYLHKGRGQDTAWALVTGASDGKHWTTSEIVLLSLDYKI